MEAYICIYCNKKIFFSKNWLPENVYFVNHNKKIFICGKCQRSLPRAQKLIQKIKTLKIWGKIAIGRINAKNELYLEILTNVFFGNDYY